MKILIATNNPAKLEEINSILADLEGIKILSLQDLNIIDKVDESASTIKKNSFDKAMFYSQISGLLTLADDSGLEIDALNGEPGIYVRRWPSYARKEKELVEAKDQELINYCLTRMKDVSLKKRGAQFHSIVCLYDPLTKEKYFFDGIIRGIIAEKPFSQHKPGYPFDSLFFFPKLNKYLAEIPINQRQEISHRSIAVTKAREKIKKLINNK